MSSIPTPKDLALKNTNVAAPEGPISMHDVQMEDVPVKRVFLRKPHLTQRPFKNETALLELRAQLVEKE